MLDPIDIFSRDWAKAKSAADPNAHYCTLATVSASAQVAMRTLVLREVVDGRFTIFTSATSPKWSELNRACSFELMVFWPILMLQYRVRGNLEIIPDELMKSHWQRKPYEAKILDLYYAKVAAQSSVVDSREQFLKDIDSLKQQFPAESDIHYPEQAKGIAIAAQYIERWQGSDTDRLHHRCLYLHQGEKWKVQTLVP